MGRHFFWTRDEDTRLNELIQSGCSQSEAAQRLTEEFQLIFTRDAVKNRLTKIAVTQPQPQQVGYKETHEIQSDGSHRSDKLLRMSAEECKDVNYLLEAHGYDKNAWELVSARNNIWNVYSKDDKIQTLYASKITVKPRQCGWTFEDLLEAIKQVQPIVIPVYHVNLEQPYLLEIPLFDAHFGISDFDYYKPTQSKIYNLLLSRRWEQVLFIIGQDMLHNDNFKGTTANGTIIQAVDMPKAWEDCKRFYELLIDTALKQSNAVKIMYAKGNHDESMSWAFIQMLKTRYPQIEFDDEVQERKVHVFGENFIGITHGDKAKKNLQSLFPAEFPVEWSQTKYREIHTGHFHLEDAKYGFGIMIRTLATRNKTDSWHKDNGFVGAHKRFMLFEYNQEELERVHYV